MTDTPGGTPPTGQTSERMQALLSQFQEEQVSEQRTVSSILTELRGQVAALADSVRGTASDASVERLGGVVSTVVADLRTSTSLLGQRLEGLSKRIDAVAQDTAAPTEQAAVRLAALQADIAAQAESVDRMQAALDVLSGFPSALAALQKDVAGLHDRVQPLAEIRSSVGDIGARTSSSLEALKPELEAVNTKVDALARAVDPERLRDAVVDGLGSRLDRLEEAASRPVVGPDVLKSGLGDLRASLDGAMGDRLEEISAGLSAVENRLGQVGERLADVGDAAGGVPGLSTDLNRLAARVEELQGLHDSLSVVGKGVAALQEDTTATALTLGVASLRDDIEHLGERLTEAAPPPVEEVAALVSQRVADRLVETLAPRIADVVLTRVSAALVSQLGEALSPRVKADTENVVRLATADSERRILAHVDEAVLALAEALLRRRRGGRGPAAALTPAAREEPPAPSEPEAPAAPVAPAPAALPEAAAAPAAAEPVPAVDLPQPAEPVQDIVDKLNAVDEDSMPDDREAPPGPAAQVPSRPSVTTGLAPASSAAPVRPAAVEPAADPDPDRDPDPAAGLEPAAEPASPVEEPDPQVAPEPVVTATPDPEVAPEVASEPSAPAAAEDRPEARTPAARARAKAAPPPPVKRSNRPATKAPAKPILERTPDLSDDDADPVRTAGRPRPSVSRPEPTQERPAALTEQAPPPPPPPPAEQRAPEKRKPWWRPGG